MSRQRLYQCELFYNTNKIIIYKNKCFCKCVEKCGILTQLSISMKRNGQSITSIQIISKIYLILNLF